VFVFGLVQPELPSLPSSSSFGQSESPNLCILTCSIFRNLDDVVHPSVGVVHGKCKLEITCPPFFFPMPVHIWVTPFFLAGYIRLCLFPCPASIRAEPHIQAFMLSLAEVVSSLVGREGVSIRCHPSIHPSIHQHENNNVSSIHPLIHPSAR